MDSKNQRAPFQLTIFLSNAITEEEERQANPVDVTRIMT